LPFFSPGRAKKRHSFHDWRIGRREALSTPEARKGRGSEHGGFYAARSCTSGVDRRSRTEPRVRREMNVEPEVQPKAAPHCFSGPALRAGDRPAWMGSVERQFHRRSQRGKGAASFPKRIYHLLILDFGCTYIEENMRRMPSYRCRKYHNLIPSENPGNVKRSPPIMMVTGVSS